MIKKSVISVWFFLSVFLLSAQTAQQLKLLGDDAFKTANYHSAVVYLEASLQLEPGNIEVIYTLADAYRHLFNYSAAQSAYLQVWNNNPDSFPSSGFWAAMMMKSQEDYPAAKIMFQKYLEKMVFSDNLVSEQRTKLEINACDSALKKIQNPIDVVIRNFSEVNTPWSEFNPVPMSDSVFVFSALRPLIETDNPLLASGDYQSQIYIAQYGSTGLHKAVPMTQNINGKDVNSANISFSPDGNRAYFNRCTYSDYKLRCDIWFSEHKNGNWSKARKLPSPLNNEKYTTTQPYVATDTISGSDLLYFSSDRPGGMGGMDLWFCLVKDGNPQAPANLGSLVNTPGNEITPFYHDETGTLYFSSDWHPGMGGYDVFMSKGAMSAWERPKNLGYAINTGANDFFFIIGSEEEAFLTSNRKGSMTFREQTCCNDIYLVRLFKEEQPVVDIIPPDTIESSIKQDILEILPLSLYFDNDHPDPRSNKPTTKVSYDESCENYLKQKQKFVDEYTKGLDGFARYYAIAEMEDFFDNYVAASIRKLEILGDLLLQDLKSGSNVTLKVRGFTSPLTSAQYNIILAKRRISSLVNYFRQWNDGVLAQYIDGTAPSGATFRIIEEASGEAMANPYVSDNPHDKQQSVYSKAASLERRIEILIYESDFKKYVNIDENLPVIYLPDNLIKMNPYVGSSDVDIEVELSNPGNVPLIVYDVEASSENLWVLSFPKEIFPGQTAIVKIKIQGPVEKSYTEFILIRSNSTDETNVVHFSVL